MSEYKNSPWQPSNEIRDLVHRSFDESLTEQDVRKIEAALSQSPEARKWYAQVVQLHADLATTCGAYEVCKFVHEEFPEEHPIELATLTSPSWSARNSRRYWISQYAAAALMLIGVGLGCGVTLFASTILRPARTFLPIPWTWKVGDDVVARLESTHDAQWQSSESPKTLPTRGLRVGQEIRLAHGTATLSFRNGVQVTVEGPTVFEVRSDSGGKLYRGRLSVIAPSDVDAFHVETRLGTAQLGPGQFGIKADDAEGTVTSEVHVFSGSAHGAVSAQFVSNHGQKIFIHDNQAMSFNDYGDVERVQVAAFDSFPHIQPPRFRAPFQRDGIYLGNLFDDSKSASLDEAMATDEYQAAAEVIDLGVAAVRDGGLDVDFSLAEDGVSFNLLNVGGGGPAVMGLPANDTYRSISSVPIRTTGENFGTSGPLPKVEEGVGISANELLTFDLDEIRAAGKLGKRAMRFISERAGINDREDPLLDSRDNAEANLIVIVSNEEEVIAAYVNGKLCEVVEQGGVYSFDLESGEIPPPLRYDGRFVSFDVPIPANARFLTLATTMLDEEHHDHCVFSGARLQIEPPAQHALDADSSQAMYRYDEPQLLVSIRSQLPLPLRTNVVATTQPNLCLR